MKRPEARPTLALPIACVLGGVGLLGPHLHAGSYAGSTPKQSVDRADLIVTGTLGGCRQVADPNRASATLLWQGYLEVRDWIKGRGESPVTIQFTRLDPKHPAEAPAHGYEDGQSGVWLLKWVAEKNTYWPVNYGDGGFRPAKDLGAINTLLAQPNAGDNRPPVPPPPPVRNVDLGFLWKSDPAHLIVAAVKPSSAAAEGKFKPDDEITGVEGTALTTAAAFMDAVGKFSPGQRIKIRAIRQSALAGTVPLTLWLLMPEVKPGGASPLNFHILPQPLHPAQGGRTQDAALIERMAKAYFEAHLAKSYSSYTYQGVNSWWGFAMFADPAKDRNDPHGGICIKVNQDGVWDVSWNSPSALGQK